MPNEYQQHLRSRLRRVWRYQRSNQNPYIEEYTTKWPNEKVQKDKQRSTKHKHKTKDRVTRTPLKPGVNSGDPVTNPVISYVLVYNYNYIEYNQVVAYDLTNNYVNLQWPMRQLVKTLVPLNKSLELPTKKCNSRNMLLICWVQLSCRQFQIYFPIRSLIICIWNRAIGYWIPQCFRHFLVNDCVVMNTLTTWGPYENDMFADSYKPIINLNYLSDLIKAILIGVYSILTLSLDWGFFIVNVHTCTNSFWTR